MTEELDAEESEAMRLYHDSRRVGLKVVKTILGQSERVVLGGMAMAVLSILEVQGRNIAYFTQIMKGTAELVKNMQEDPPEETN